MLFNSYSFLLVFLPITVAGFFVLGRMHRGAAAGWLALASIFFYAYWDVRFVALLLASIAANFGTGLALWKLRSKSRITAAHVVLAVAVAANLVLLGYFKYTNFFLSSINAALGSSVGPAEIILPLGISFYTFTQIAFLVDTARGEVREFNFIHYALFVTYFPHLIAGPILHHREMMPQFREPSVYRFNAEDFSVGLAFLAFGLFKKCVLADSLSPDVNQVFEAAAKGDALTAGMAWKGAVGYTLQLYFDFSGYSDMAVGLSRMLGIRLPFNFDSPYRAANIVEFWRRWHMTLSRFLRDYLYFPLGGNRRGPVRRHLNLMVTMVLGGLWHGAAWTFVVWGALHGAYLVVNHSWRAVRQRFLAVRPVSSLEVFAGRAITFVAVAVAWVFFRSADLATAWRMLEGMAGAHGFGWPTDGMKLIFMGLAIVFLLPNSQQIIEGMRERPTGVGWERRLAFRLNPLWGGLVGLMIAASMLTFSRVSEFLYFQF